VIDKNPAENIFNIFLVHKAASEVWEEAAENAPNPRKTGKKSLARRKKATIFRPSIVPSIRDQEKRWAERPPFLLPEVWVR
jgi:hypothetical protein